MNDGLQASLQATLTERYGIGAIDKLSPVTAGYLSQNYVVWASDKRYFLKCYRFTKAEPIERAHAAQRHFADAGIPVILPLSSSGGETFFCHTDTASEVKFYSLFPFVEGRQIQRGDMGTAALTSAAQLLARLHRIGQDVQLPGMKVLHKTVNVEEFHTTTEQVLARISQQPSRNEFDELATATLQLKLALAAQHPPDFAALGLVSDHQTHGDYHDGNFFFDEQDQVSHLFDWEKAEIAPRERELVRSILFLCLEDNEHQFKVNMANLARTRIYLRTYHALYPLDPAKLAAAIHMRFLDQIYSLWIEHEHYLLHNNRVDLFLPSSYTMLQYLSANLSSFTERLCEDLT